MGTNNYLSYKYLKKIIFIHEYSNIHKYTLKK